MFIAKLVLLGLALLPIVAFGLIFKHLVSAKPADANKIIGKGDDWQEILKEREKYQQNNSEIKPYWEEFMYIDIFLDLIYSGVPGSVYNIPYDNPLYADEADMYDD